MKTMTEPKSLYIHVPFCERKCNYCAFESAVPREGDIDLWLGLLPRELELRLAGTRPRLATCYFGGGTPTVLNGPQWRRLIEIIERRFEFDKNAEVTVEANPNSLRAEQLLEWRDWRVTRLSIGVQSFDDAELAMMGRLHTASQARCALSAALASGFAVSGDFIFGLPYQSFQNWGRTLREAANFGLSHISLYQLSLEPGTPWAKLDGETLGDGYAAYRFAQWYLPKKGFTQYEVANFARPGCESRHNINYWREGDYLGIGPGAAGYIDGTRGKSYGSLTKWAEALTAGRLPSESEERLAPDARAREAAVLGLRMCSGLNIADYIRDYGEKQLEELTAKMANFPKELWKNDGERLRLTKKGMRVANLIWEELV